MRYDCRLAVKLVVAWLVSQSLTLVADGLMVGAAGTMDCLKSEGFP